MRGRDFPHPSRPAVGLTQPPIQQVPGLSRGVKRPGRGVDHPTPSSAEVKERVELHLYSPSGFSWPFLGATFIFNFNFHNNQYVTLHMTYTKIHTYIYIYTLYHPSLCTEVHCAHMEGNKLMFLPECVKFLRRPALQGGGRKNLMTARVSMLLKSRASLTCFRACFPPGRAKDLSAPR